MSEFTPEPGWLQRQAESVEREVAQWPDSMKVAAGIDPADWPHPLQVELDRTKAELARKDALLAAVPSEEEWARLKANDGVMLDLERQLAKVTEERDRLRGQMEEAIEVGIHLAVAALSQHEPIYSGAELIAMEAPPEPAKPEAPKCGVCDGSGMMGRATRREFCDKCSGTGRAQ